MRSVYTNYVRLYLLMDYSRDDSEFYALLETDDLWERPEPKKQCNNADKETPEKEDATIPEPEALDEQCKTNKKATLPRENSQAILDRVKKRFQVLRCKGYKCFSQAFCQAVSMTVSKKWLTNIELDKIKAECEDECCNPPGSSGSATSSAILGSVNTAIPEAATEHSEIRRLLILANENSKSGEAATEHSEIPEAACQEAKRPRKSVLFIDINYFS